MFLLALSIVCHLLFISTIIIFLSLQWQTILGWTLCLSAFPLITYGPIFPGPMDDRVRPYNDVNTFFVAINKPVWALTVAWVIFACAIGKGGTLRKHAMQYVAIFNSCKNVHIFVLFLLKTLIVGTR